MAYCIRTRLKKYKNKTYKYFELVNTHRDSSNKKKVISDFKCHLGKDKAQIKANLERYKQESSGKYSVERLARAVEKQLAKGINPADVSNL